jgi:chromosomal replication initiator protein
VKIRHREAAATLAQAIARRIGEARYRLWFERHTRFHCEEGQLTVGVPNRHFEEWLHKTFGAAVSEAAAEVLGRSAAVRFAIDPELFQAARREQAAVGSAQPAGSETARRPEAPSTVDRPRPGKSAPGQAATETPRSRPRDHAALPAGHAQRARRWKHLHNFVSGPCNRVAHAAALSVVEQPGEGANPVVLYGPIGTGKTHLLEGIYAGLRRSHPDWRVRFATAEDFTNRFVQSMRLGKLSAFRRNFRESDVLLLDDLHFLAGKKATQEEFLHTFDDLAADGRQIVVACDCHPRLADDFTPELADRLLGGVVWGLAPADADTRLAILRAKAAEGPGAPPSVEVLEFLAQQLRGNVRELEGALHSVRHFAHVTGRPLDVVLVREALGDLLRHAVRVVQLADVDRAVRATLRLEHGALQARARNWAASHPRMVAMYLARKHTAAAYSAIGAHFGGMNHSTAVAAEKKVRQWMDADVQLSLGDQRIRTRELVERIERELLK